MKQNKRFILLVVMVLLANCLFAGLASAATEKQVNKLYVMATDNDGFTLTSASEIATEVGYGTTGATYNKDTGALNSDVGPFSFQFSTLNDTTKKEKSLDGGNVVKVTYSETDVAESNGTLGFVIKTSDASVVALSAYGPAEVTTDSTIAYQPKYGGHVEYKFKKLGSATITITAVNGPVDAARELKVRGNGNSVSFKATLNKAAINSIVLRNAKSEYTVGTTITYGLSDNTTTYALAAKTSASGYTGSGAVELDKISWSADPADVALIDTTNKTFSFQKAGTVKITVASSINAKVKDTVTLTVKEKNTTPITKIVYKPTELDYEKTKDANGKLWFNHYRTVEPTAGHADIVKEEYISSDEDILVVDSELDKDGNRVYFAKSAGKGKNGKATINVKLTDAVQTVIEGKVDVNVTGELSKLNKLTVEPESLILYYLNVDEHTEGTLKATANKEVASSALTWSWTSKDPSVAIPSVATSSSSMTIIPTGAGKTEIVCSVTDGTVTLTKEIPVTVSSKAIEGKGVTDDKGEKSSTQYLKAKGKTTVQLKADGKVTYKSENEEIATVDAKGVVTVVGLGKTHIIATNEKGEASLYGLNIKKAPVTKITAKDVTVKVGEKKAIKWSVNKDAYQPTVKFSITSEAAKAKFSVSKDGVVEGLAKGTGKIKIKAGKVEAKIKVVVKK
jgi:hypothetical protein